jgi:hypothetical protein
MKLHAIGIDLGKTVFHLVGLDSSGKVVVRKRCSRMQLLAYTANGCKGSRIAPSRWRPGACGKRPCGPRTPDFTVLRFRGVVR